MAVLKLKILLLVIFNTLTIFAISSRSSNSFSTQNFLTCFSSHLPPNYSNKGPVSSGIILTKNSSSFPSVFQSSIRNRRFSDNTSVPKPELILVPFDESHIQAAIICSKQNELQIRVRSGGHDYEGLSYVSDNLSPFMVIDLANFRSIKVDIKSDVAFVGAGATLGELYYSIAEKSRVHAFPAGSCPTVGVGGHLSGGGFGTIFRKYGLAADNILDARIVNVNGEVLTRKSMGEDLFWAIRGGGASSFGVIISWKLRLVRVSPTVTISHFEKAVEDGGTRIFNKWQAIGSQLHEDLFLHVTTGVVTVNGTVKTVMISLTSLFLGSAERLVALMDAKFPELGLQIGNCTEMSWIQSVLYFAGFSVNGPLEVLRNRTSSVGFFKAKSDYVTEAIPEAALEGLWARHVEDEGSFLIWTPYGGKMSEISDSEIPFPHRRGNLYGIQYVVNWSEEEESESHIEWMRRFYRYMEPYVSKSPRAAYLNYRDLDIGTNDNVGNTSYLKASVWGLKYFKHNFKRLARVKTNVDPSNYFRNEQSIPVLQYRKK